MSTFRRMIMGSGGGGETIYSAVISQNAKDGGSSKSHSYNLGYDLIFPSGEINFIKSIKIESLTSSSGTVVKTFDFDIPNASRIQSRASGTKTQTSAWDANSVTATLITSTITYINLACSNNTTGYVPSNCYYKFTIITSRPFSTPIIVSYTSGSYNAPSLSQVSPASGGWVVS